MNRRTTLRTLALAAGAAALAACAPMAGNEPDIVDIAAANPDFSTLVAAVQAAGLEDTLRGAGPFTVFAPTDAAFAALPAGTLDSLLLPENRDQLAAILTYHVAPGIARSGDLAGKVLDVTTAQGGSVRVDGRDGVTVNGANVTAADIEAANGVIHVIDRVLLPR